MPRSLQNHDRLELGLARLAEGESLRAVERDLEINRKSLAVRARAAGIELASPGHPEEYAINHLAFADVRRPDQAYVLGVLAADGCVHVPKDGRAPMIGLHVQASDAWMLRTTCRVLGTDYARIRRWDATVRGRRHAVAGLQVSSAQIAADLARNGIGPGKTFNLSFPRQLSVRLQRHWLRGFFDGDGSTAYVSKGQPKVNVGFCGPRTLMADIARTLYKRCGLKLLPTVSQNGARPTNWRVQWRDRADVHRIVEYLYADGGATLSLLRKRALLLRALGCPRHTRPATCSLATLIERTVSDHVSWEGEP